MLYGTFLVLVLLTLCGRLAIIVVESTGFVFRHRPEKEVIVAIPGKRRLACFLTAIAISASPLAGTSQVAAADQGPGHGGGHGPKRGYVAMGDSFSSGEGTGVYLAGTDTADNRCHRSPLAYPPLLSEDSRRLRPLTFVACSGAATRDLYTTNAANPSEGPQLDALKRRTRAVSLTIGGNDVVFVDVARACVQVGASTGFGCSTNPSLNAVVNARLAALAGASVPGTEAITPISKVLADINRASPRAEIYLGGYPELFGSRSRNFLSEDAAPSGSVCVVNRTLGAGVDFDDAQWINSRTRQLNAILRDGVQQARRAGVRATFVPASRFDSHGLCDDRTSWIQPLLVDGTGGVASVRSESLHPTAEGHRRGYAPAFEAAGL